MTNPKNHPGKGVPFERIRRITGYLVGTMDKWNDAKKAEESERERTQEQAQAKAVQMCFRGTWK